MWKNDCVECTHFISIKSNKSELETLKKLYAYMLAVLVSRKNESRNSINNFIHNYDIPSNCKIDNAPVKHGTVYYDFWKQGLFLFFHLPACTARTWRNQILHCGPIFSLPIANMATITPKRGFSVATVAKGWSSLFVVCKTSRIVLNVLHVKEILQLLHWRHRNKSLFKEKLSSIYS